MGQNTCKCAQLDFAINKVSKSSLLRQQLLDEFDLPNKQNLQLSQLHRHSQISQSSKLPNKYLNLYIILKHTQKKFTDTYYSHAPFVRPGNLWYRLSQKAALQNLLVKSSKVSKFCQIINFITKNYTELIPAIKPMYLESVGLAICKIWVQGCHKEIIIDDYLPIQRLGFAVEGWVLLLEKAMSKVLGDYEYLEEFSVGQLFSEITGIPHYRSAQPSLQTFQTYSEKYINQLNKNNKNFRSFKEVLKCDQILFQTSRFNKDDSIFAYRQNYKVTSISFEGNSFRPTVIKMVNLKKQSICLRVVQPSSLYEQKKNRPLLEEYPPIVFQCIHEGLGPFGSSVRSQNCLYINDIFTEFEQGTYWIFIKQLKSQERLNIISYSETAPKFAQIHTNIEKHCVQVLRRIKNSYNDKNIKQIAEIGQENLILKLYERNNKILIEIQKKQDWQVGSDKSMSTSRQKKRKSLRIMNQNSVGLTLDKEGKIAEVEKISLQEVYKFGHAWVIILGEGQNRFKCGYGVEEKDKISRTSNRISNDIETEIASSLGSLFQIEFQQ